MIQKVSLPDEWRDAYLKKLESENADVRHSSDVFVQNLKTDISAVSARLSRLTDAYLNEALELGEYLEHKNALTAEKRTLEEKLSDFERNGNHWLGLMRNWILEANQVGNLIKNLTTRFFRGFALVKFFYHEQILLLGEITQFC